AHRQKVREDCYPPGLERQAAIPPRFAGTPPRKPDSGNRSVRPALSPGRRRASPSLVATVRVSHACFLILHFALQPGTGRCPFTFHRCWRNAQHDRSFLNGETAKEP